MKKLLYILPVILLSSLLFCYGSEYSTELQEAYNRAYENSVTTQPTIDTANMKGKITRQELAKMITNYAINILGKTPDTTKTCLFPDSNIIPDLVPYVIKSCQLGLMGQGIDSFRPTDTVTRAEFGTILSRALWGDKNEGGDTYYQKHLKALKAEGIMNNISSPMDKEIRGYVMLMLMRSSNIDINNPEKINIDDQISEVIKMLD